MIILQPVDYHFSIKEQQREHHITNKANSEEFALLYYYDN